MRLTHHPLLRRKTWCYILFIALSSVLLSAWVWCARAVCEGGCSRSPDQAGVHKTRRSRRNWRMWVPNVDCAEPRGMTKAGLNDSNNAIFFGLMSQATHAYHVQSPCGVTYWSRVSTKHRGWCCYKPQAQPKERKDRYGEGLGVIFSLQDDSHNKKGP